MGCKTNLKSHIDQVTLSKSNIPNYVIPRKDSFQPSKALSKTESTIVVAPPVKPLVSTVSLFASIPAFADSSDSHGGKSPGPIEDLTGINRSVDFGAELQEPPQEFDFEPSIESMSSQCESAMF